jgi:hypothetical protein
LRGPVTSGGPPELLLFYVRRYLCTACGATCTVVPAEGLTRRLYGASAIAWALALFGVLAMAADKVRERVSPWKVVGPCAADRWPTLLRWTRAAGDRRLWRCVRPSPPSWSLRRVAERAATTLAGYAPLGPAPPLDAQAFLGAALAR